MINHANFYFDKEKGLFYEKTFLINANVSVIKKRRTINSQHEKIVNYLVEVMYSDGRPRNEKWIKDLKKLDLWNFEVNDAVLEAESRNLIIFKLLYEAEHLPMQRCLENISGFTTLDETSVFFFGQHILLPEKEKLENVDFTSKYQMQITEGICITSVANYLNMYPGVTEVLFYASLYAVVKPFVGKMKINGGFINALVGPPGHLKTSMIRKYALWLDNREQQEMGFYYSTRNRSILDLVEEMSGLNYLLDDLRRVTNRSENMRQQQRLEAIARHVNSKGECANLFITGESLSDMGIFSCIDRTLQIKIPQTSSSEIAELKKRMSAMPDDFMRNLAFLLAKRLMDNIDEVFKDIKEFYDSNSNLDKLNNETVMRTERYAMFLKLTRFLFCKYLKEIDRGQGDEEKFEVALEKQVAIQCAELQGIREKEVVKDYVIDFYEFFNKRKVIRVIIEKEEYFFSDDSCYLSFKNIYITKAALENAFLTYYERYIPTKEIVKQFQDKGILEVESGSRGKQKNFKGKKHYVINMRMLLYYLHSKDYPISEELLNTYGISLER